MTPMLTPFRLGLALFTAAYTVAFGIYFLSVRNEEFLAYVGVVVLLVILVAATLRRSRIPDWLLALLSLWGVAHMAGGSIFVGDHVLYAQMLLPIVNNGDFAFIRYDQLVHAYGFGLAAVLVYYLLDNAATTVNQFWFGVVAILAGMGLGVINEVVEFIAVISLPHTGVGGYDNTMLDIIANTIGAAAAVVLFALSRRLKRRD